MDGEYAQRGQNWLVELLRLSGFSTTVESGESVTSLEADSCWLTIDHNQLTPVQIERLVGPQGSTIDAIQYLANTILNLGKPPTEQQAYTIELGGYRLQRHTELRAIAETAAAQVRATGEDFVIPSLSAAERRLIHTYLKDFADLQTYSQGQEPQRYLTVRRPLPEA
ncbi:hypothetical protein DO97_21200 [Neosynechococcus sphagnicola sy1]|uniref:R3H domain-containing protein n=1 Tax=Neosynechococcus sphagnicola sy1 TaxID=1497020 RepID=A0A098TLZ5_9CYAN|nr:R3H domain-containing nucleic acid-binding protein [Neosynechococcus sphagnicola]KGF73329.1 hypothetical protein DO97_21200 [Neosynechococcus sphagnicola sy1]